MILFQSFADQDLARQFSSTVASLEQQNELQRLINDAMSQGATGADARRIAEEQLRDVFVAQVQSAVERLGLEQSIADNLVEQVTKSRELRSQSEALTEERRKLDQATGFLENLEQENLLLATATWFYGSGCRGGRSKTIGRGRGRESNFFAKNKPC
jgi:hypothetical protein